MTNETFEEKLEKKKLGKELKEIFPNYGEYKTIKEGGKFLRCKLFGHKRMIHHAFYTEETERGKDYYEVYVCIRCKDIQGKLVNIVKKD
jgi:hypothetical protein